MGHIELAAPVSHIWYFKGIPSRLGLMLDMTPRQLEQVLYFAEYVVVDPGDTPLQEKQVLSDVEYADMREKYEDDFVAGMGAEYVRMLLEKIDLEKLSAELKPHQSLTPFSLQDHRIKTKKEQAEKQHFGFRTTACDNKVSKTNFYDLDVISERENE